MVKPSTVFRLREAIPCITPLMCLTGKPSWPSRSLSLSLSLSLALSMSGSHSPPPPSLTVCLRSQRHVLSFQEGLTMKNYTVKAFLYIIMSLRNVFSTSLVLGTRARAIRTNSKSDSSPICSCCELPAPVFVNNGHLLFTYTRKGQSLSFYALIMGLCSAISKEEIGSYLVCLTVGSSVSVSDGHRRSGVSTPPKFL